MKETWKTDHESDHIEKQEDQSSELFYRISMDFMYLINFFLLLHLLILSQQIVRVSVTARDVAAHQKWRYKCIHSPQAALEGIFLSTKGDKPEIQTYQDSVTWKLPHVALPHANLLGGLF